MESIIEFISDKPVALFIGLLIAPLLIGETCISIQKWMAKRKEEKENIYKPLKK